MDNNKKLTELEFDSFPVSHEKVKVYTEYFARHVEAKGHYLFRIFFLFLHSSVRILTYKGAHRFGKFIGLLFYWSKLRRNVAMTNLELTFGDKKTTLEKETIYRESLINFGRVIINWLRLPYKGEKFWRENVRFRNEDVLRNAMNKKKGAILLAAHIGMWDLAGGKIGMSGYPISVVARRIKNSFLDRWVINTRCRMNFGSIQNKNSMDRIREGLNRGEAVAMAIDQSMQPAQGVFINWMGRPACSVRSAAYLAKETGAPVISGYLIQHGPKEFELVCGEEIIFESHPDPKQELLINTQKQSDVIQKIILEHPEKWFWIHKRWKVQPEGASNPYPSSSKKRKK